MKVAVIFGGKSTEHDVSVVSGTSVIKNLNKSKYEILPIYIDKEGKWYKYKKEVKDIEVQKIGEKLNCISEIENVVETLKKQDVVFPVMHGKFGEDGSIQGLLELIGVPYVGCKILASSIAMDKVYTKIILDRADILQAKSEYIKVDKGKYIYLDKNLNEKISTIEEICEICEKSLKYPMFIKPSNSGSSVGVSKAHTKEELKQGIKTATKYDVKILIEEGIVGREVECAILGNKDIIASCVRRNKNARRIL